MSKSEDAGEMHALRPAVVAAGVALLTLLVYLPALMADFVRWDDDVNVYENHHVYGLTWENLRWMAFDLGQALRYKPLSWMTWAAVYEICGLRPMGYHLLNVLLHSINAALAFVLLLNLVSSGGNEASRCGTISAGIGALVWSLHPLRVEPVAWVTGMPYALSLLFALVFMLCYLRHLTCWAGSAARSPWYLGSVVAFIGGLFSYPLTIGMAVTPVAMENWRHRVGVRWRHLPFLLAAAAMVALNVAGRYTPSKTYLEAATLQDHGLLARAMQGFYCWTYFLLRHVWTADLSFIYHRLFRFNPLAPVFLFSAFFVAGVSIWLYRIRARWPSGWWVWLCHLAWLVPVLGLTENRHSPADRYTYAGGLLIGLLVAAGLMKVSGTARWRPALLLSVGALAFFGVQTLVLIPVWRDTGSLFRHGIRLMGQAEQRSSFLTQLGHWHLLRGEFAEAETQYRRALDGAADPVDLQHRIADALYRQNRFSESLPHYEAAHAGGGLGDEYLGDYGFALVAAGRVETAEAIFAEAVRRAPDQARHRHNWALTLKRLGRLKEAAEQEAEAIRLRR